MTGTGKPRRGVTLAFPEHQASPQAVRARHRMTELFDAAVGFGLQVPVLFNGQLPQGGELTAVWQHTNMRITVYLIEDAFEVELVPDGPAALFTTGSAEAAAAFVAGLHTAFERGSREL